MKAALSSYSTLVLLAFGIYAQNSSAATLANQANEPINIKIAQLESAVGGKIGIYAKDTSNNNIIQYRGDERFPFCSTSKVMVVGAILKSDEKTPGLLQKNIKYSQKEVDRSGYSPITKQHVNEGMSISELSQAALEHTDNTAMNLLIKQMGGTKVITSFARNITDDYFRLDRLEPELNTAIPGDLRDTTTPKAMGNSLQQLALGNILAAKQRNLLTAWLKSNTTGDFRIRAGTPKKWIVGDKTGTGDYGTTNDIGIIWPPNCSPIIMVIYYTQNMQDAKPKDAVIASTAHLLVDEFAKNNPCLNPK